MRENALACGIVNIPIVKVFLYAVGSAYIHLCFGSTFPLKAHGKAVIAFKPRSHIAHGHGVVCRSVRRHICVRSQPEIFEFPIFIYGIGHTPVRSVSVVPISRFVAVAHSFYSAAVNLYVLGYIPRNIFKRVLRAVSCIVIKIEVVQYIAFGLKIG